MKPLVSVIIPNFNHAPYLRQRIDSVLNQRYDNFEVFLLDDCSTDNSREILLSYKSNPKVKAILLNEKNSGSTFKQWEKGFNLVHGEYIWIAESDDYCDSDFLEKLVEQLSDGNKYSIAYTSSHLVNAQNSFIKKMRGKGVVKYSGSDFISRKMIYRNAIVNASSAIFSKEALSKIPNDYVTYKAGGDYLFWIYLAEQGGVIHVLDAHNYFRQHYSKVSPNAAKSGLVFYETNRIYKYLKSRNYFEGLKEHIAHGYYMWLISKVDFDDKEKKMEVLDLWKAECSCPYLNKYLFLCKHSYDKIRNIVNILCN